MTALDKGIETLTFTPENMAGLPAKIAAQAQNESAGKISGAVHASEFGPPSANRPLARVEWRPCAPPKDQRVTFQPAGLKVGRKRAVSPPRFLVQQVIRPRPRDRRPRATPLPSPSAGAREKPPQLWV